MGADRPPTVEPETGMEPDLDAAKEREKTWGKDPDEEDPTEK